MKLVKVRKSHALLVHTYRFWHVKAYVTLRLRSGEVRKVPSDCRATIGEVGNAEHMLRSLGKAGATRWRGVRPTVRGVAMNPVDHPHGGGEGRTGRSSSGFSLG